MRATSAASFGRATRTASARSSIAKASRNNRGRASAKSRARSCGRINRRAAPFIIVAIGDGVRRLRRVDFFHGRRTLESNQPADVAFADGLSKNANEGTQENPFAL